MERKAHSKIPLVRGNAGTNQGMRPVDKNIHSLHRSIVGTRRRRRNGVAHTLRVSEKRRPSCNEDMSSVMWEETDDGDIATASMGGSGDRRLPCCQYSPTSLLPLGSWEQQQNPALPCWATKTPQRKQQGAFQSNPLLQWTDGGGGGGVAHRSPILRGEPGRGG
jgi:hypothetical protein